MVPLHGTERIRLGSCSRGARQLQNANLYCRMILYALITLKLREEHVKSGVTHNRRCFSPRVTEVAP